MMTRIATLLGDKGRRIFLNLAAGFGMVTGASLSMLLFYTLDTAHAAISDYRVSSASLKDDVLTISGRLTMARNCEMNYIAFYGDNDGTEGSVNLAQYSRKKVMALTRTIDYGMGSSAFGPIVVPVPDASKYDWLVIVSSHKCHPFWPHITQLVKLNVHNIEVRK